MKSDATNVADYLNGLAPDRKSTLESVRAVILANLDRDFEEGMQYGMIGYYVPHRIYPAGYHCNPKEPLPFAALGSQKNHMALHLMAVYGDEDQLRWFQEAWAASGKKLDMGKACLRFKRLEDVALDVIGASFQRVSAQNYISRYEQLLRRGKK